MRGFRSVATGQRTLEAIEAVHAIRRGDLCRAAGHAVKTMRPPERVRYEAWVLSQTLRDL